MARPADAVANWASLERRYRQASRVGKPSRVVGASYGRRRILLTAPHAGPQTRNGMPKQTDNGTGGLAEAMARRVGCAVVTVIGVQADDPNWDVEVGAFKNEALRRLRTHPFAIDIHAMRRDRTIDVCIGTGPAPDQVTLDYARWCATQARAAGLVVGVNQPFPAAAKGTMTAFAQRSGYRGVQIEINARLLDPGGNPDDARQLFALLAALIDAAPA